MLLVGCAPKFRVAPLAAIDTNAAVMSEAQKERDEIYLLAAYAVVYNDWQTKSGAKQVDFKACAANRRTG